MGNTVLVTGGAGFIGSELVRQLATRKYAVRIVDNLVNGKKENIDEVLSDRVTFHEIDIRDQGQMTDLLAGVDIVFHLACLGVRHSIHDPHENHDVNATATLGLLFMAKDNCVKRFVYVSSSEVYGTARKVPMDELHPTFPMTVYGGSKLAGESYTRAFNRTYNYPTVIVRPFNSYGPRSHHEGDSGEVIPKFMLRAMAGKELIVFGDGEQTRDFSYVSDTARGIIACGTSDRVIGETVNIGFGKEISINTLAEEIEQVVGNGESKILHVEERPGDVLRLFANTLKVEELLGYKPEIGLQQGLAKLKAWYKEQGVAPEELLKQETALNWIVE